MYSFLIRILPCVFLFVSVHLAEAQDGTSVDLLILAGQSNMVGRAVPTESIPGNNPLDDEVRYYFDVLLADGSTGDDSSGSFGPLRPWNLGPSRQNFGPEMSIGRSIAAERDVAMVKIAIGGSTISSWQPGRSYFNQLSTAVKDGIAQLHAEGREVHVAGLVWMQGESDDGISQQRYSDRLETLVSGFRQSLNNELPSLGFADLDVFLVEPTDWGNGSQPGVILPPTPVDNALMEFAASDDHSRFIRTEDLNTFIDSIHLGPQDQTVLGQRIAYAVLGLPDNPNIVGGWRQIGRDSHWDDINVAQAGVASQSSVHRESYAASNALDGNDRTSARTSSEASEHWWQVDLGEVIDLDEIRITNGSRSGRYLTDGGGFRAEVLLSDETVVWQQDFVMTEMDTDRLLAIELPSPEVLGQVVRLSKLQPVSEGSRGQFRLAEVEVLADSQVFEMNAGETWFFDIDGGNGTADVLDIDGQLELGDSNLDVTLIQGEVSDGDSFDLLDFESLSGTFANIKLPELADSLEWDLSQLYVDGSISAIQSVSGRGDIDGDGLLTTADIRQLIDGIAERSADNAFDMNGDSKVDINDLTTWVVDLKMTWIGDANLDGEFSSEDMVAVFQAGKYELDEDAGWAEGDWNGDARFGSEDMVAAFTDGGYEQGPREAVNAVPEPASIVLLMGGLIGIAFCHRRNR